MNARVHVERASKAPRLPSERSLRGWVRAALAGRRDSAEVCVRVVDEPEMRALNARYRGKDYATNVLTFILHDQAPFEGDLALCAPVVAREARTQKKSLAAHYAHLTVHGVLHLQGFDHENDADASLMEARETAIMAKLGYADPYQN